MRKIFTLKRILLALLVILAVMQFFRIDKTNAPVIAEQDFINHYNPPQNVQDLLKAACYDCHSNVTVYPWYSNIAPLSWWLKDHINEGREEMNFSEWTTFKAKKKAKRMEQCAKLVKNEEMPLPSYTWMHSASRLTPEQRTILIDWFQKQSNNPTTPAVAEEVEEVD